MINKKRRGVFEKCMGKRTIAMILSVVMLISILPMHVFAVEDSGHQHTELCYAQAGDLLCDKQESEGHLHEESCYCSGGEYICNLVESEGHTHDDSCYLETEEYEVASDSEAQEKQLICELEETEGHLHNDECICLGDELVCELEEAEGHAHSETCFARGDEIICGLEEQSDRESVQGTDLERIAEPPEESVNSQEQYASADVIWISNAEELEQSVRPESVVLTLMYSNDDGATWKEYWGQSQYNVTSTANENGKTWHYEWTLPACDEEGNPIIFKVEENKLGFYVTEYKEEYSVDESGKKITQFTVTNTYQDIPWDYSIELKWELSDSPLIEVASSKSEQYYDAFTKGYTGEKAILTISTNLAYDIGDLTVRMPYSLFTKEHCRDGHVEGVDIGLPLAPETNEKYCFNYWIDTHNSKDKTDWEIVFSNWMPIESGYNISIPIVYKINPYYVIDCSKAELTAVGSGISTIQEEAVEHVSNAIYYRLDTGVSTDASLAHSGQPIYSWLPQYEDYYGLSKDEFDPKTYNYVCYAVNLRGNLYYNQPFIIELACTPGENGQVIGINGHNDVTYDGDNGVWRTEIILDSDRTSKNDPNAYLDMIRCTWSVIVAYPRADMTTESMEYTHTATMKVLAADAHAGDKGEEDTLDVIEQTASGGITWKEFELPTGVTFSKQRWGGFKSGALTAWENGSAQITDWKVSTTINGYQYENGYSFELYDDVIYAATNKNDSSSYLRLDAEDYEFCGNNYSQVVIKSSDIDRATGETIEGMIPEEDFRLLGRKGNSGAWEEITTIEMTGSNTTYRISKDLLDGKGYTQIKLVSPEGLEGAFTVDLYIGCKILPTSPVVQRMLDEGATGVLFTNFAALKYYAPETAGGEYVWQNPKDSSDNFIRDIGLSAEDRTEYGKNVTRVYAYDSMGRAKSTGSAKKSISSVKDDKTNHTYGIQFCLEVQETIEVPERMDDAFYENWAAESGTFYDLLPMGYTFDKSSAVEVKGYKLGTNQYSPTAEIVSVETIDNYRDSGRQMVIIKVKEKTGEQNYSINSYSGSGSSGFYVTFWAVTTYDDIIIHGPGYNNMVYQRGDLRTIGGGHADVGYYTVRGANLKPYPTDENGNFILEDINEDGDTSTKNTLLSSVLVEPNIQYSTETGIRKMVKANSAIYGSSDSVNLGGDYSYRIIVQTSDKGLTKDVIIYDTLELVDQNPGWKGTLVGVNIATMRLKGVDVKVYYSRSPISDIDEEAKKLDNGKWLPLDSDTDLTQVKALAFDMRKTITQDEMVFDENSFISVEIFMKAPASMQTYEFAYNRSAYSCTIIQDNSTTESPMNNVSNVSSVALPFETYTLDYVVKGDSQYGTPSDAVIPEIVTEIPWNTDKDLQADCSTSWKSSDGTATGIPGEWIFTGWSTDMTYADDLAVKNIKQNETVYGKWSFIPYTGSLTVEKILEGNDVDSSKEFSFTVTLSNTSISGIYGDVTFYNGVGTFTLKGGESKVIKSLPHGTEYIVSEEDYTTDGYVTTKMGDTGTIVGGDNKHASFTNRKDKDIPSSPPDEPTTPTDPNKPTTPSEPDKPTTPSEPDEPTTPSKPDKPTTPSEPDEPTTPTEPDKPTTPSEPDEPTTPSEPDKPTTPSEPDEPTTPSEPNEPAAPALPDNAYDDVPKTGDTSHTALWFALMCISVVGVIITSRKLRYKGMYSKK